MNFAECLGEIRPETSLGSEKYSFNLAEVLALYQERLGEVRVLFVPCESRPLWTPEITCTPQLYLGIPSPDGGLTGRKFSRVIVVGARAESWALPPGRFPLGFSDVTEAFLEGYLRLGKCAIDPEHRLEAGIGERYTLTDEDHRVCNWCGQREAREVVRRVVVKDCWHRA